MMNPEIARRPIGVSLLAIFFAFGTSMCALTILLLAFPSSSLSVLWALNPEAHSGFQSLGAWAIVLMLVVGAACATAAVGLWRGTALGRGIAIVVLAINLLGDILNVALRHDLRALIGVPIGAAFIWYLLGAAARKFCPRHQSLYSTI
jgi:hypothetical protein